MRTTPTSLYLSEAKTSRKVTLDPQVVGPRRVEGRGVFCDFYSLGPLDGNYQAIYAAGGGGLLWWHDSVLCKVFKVLRNGLLRFIFYTCPNLVILRFIKPSSFKTPDLGLCNT